MFEPRPKQREVLAYRRGYMGVAAVPGSGKTATLSYLAARLLSEVDLQEGQEILVVTLVNAAALNFARQIQGYVQTSGLLPGFGYRARTLHGLANDIVRQKPTAAGLDDAYIIVDERESGDILTGAVEAWLRRNPETLDAYVKPEHLGKPRIRSHSWLTELPNIAGSFIKQAKNALLSPADLRRLLAERPNDLPLARIFTEMYDDYEGALRYRGAVDFQDLISRALLALQNDRPYLQSLQHKYLYILEDEAQDSSLLQERILRLLAGDKGSWIRVGDPNQAIYETFTTADPKYLRAFISSPTVTGRELPNSGRNTVSIQKLANALISWTLQHPHDAIRDRIPLDRPYIQPSPPGDPQPNPPDDPAAVVLYPKAFTPTAEAMTVTESCKRWLADNPDSTAAILVARNTRGSELVKLLRQKEVPYVENLNSTSSTRAVAGALTRILEYLADPKDARKLAKAYQVSRRHEKDDPEAAALIANAMTGLSKMKTVEDYIAPRLSDWLEDTLYTDQDIEARAQLEKFRDHVSLWLRAAALPIDQLILTIAGALFTDVGEIATAHMAALHLSRLSETHPMMRLPEFAKELRDIAENRRRFVGLGDDEGQFDADAHKGKVTVTTLHKAKGLEWDRVYLVSANNYDFPSAEAGDSYISEKWFVRDNLNLSAEALAQLEALHNESAYREGFASLDARIDYAAERLRLLYVGITRARKALTITWNTGRNGDATEAAPLLALRTFWEEETRKRTNDEPAR